MRIVAGCDGGGTKCHVRVCVVDDSQAIVRTGEFISGPSNVRSNPDAALQNIQAATCEALLAAGIPRDGRIETFVAALAGSGDLDRQREWQIRLADVLPVAQVLVVPDPAILFAAADVEDGSSAVATIVGTGAIAWARNQIGEITRAGGLGPKIGDEGSGYWIGREALRRSSDWTGAVGDSAFRERIALVTDESDVAQVASLSADVFRLAASDSQMRSIVDDAAEEIATLVADAVQAIETSPDCPLRWVCAGGVAVNQARWLRAVQDRCIGKGVFLQSPDVISRPVEGAIKMALK